MDDQVIVSHADSLSHAEIETQLQDGPGVLIVRGAYQDNSLLDVVADHFYKRIQREGGHAADHFAAGSNQRLWNSLNKLAEDAPQLFADYYGNEWLHVVSEAWLGPLYQITAQVNVVVPGGSPQTGHRDYHLGFYPESLVRKMPDLIRQASTKMTLQGAIIHCDVPTEMGPTKLLLGSQKDPDGYLTYRRAEEQTRFERECSQIPFKKGDLVFFNPSIFHAAGGNNTSAPRLVNLLQVSTALAKPMEHIDFIGLVKHVYPHLLDQTDEALVARAIRALVDAYPFPSNLDRDPPSDDWLGELETSWLLEAWRVKEAPEVVIAAYIERREKRIYNTP